MNKIVYLHVGKHKTGTTSIQAYLFKNKGFLLDQGFEFFDCSDLPERLANGNANSRQNAYTLAHVFLRPELLTPMRIRKTSLHEWKLEDRVELAHMVNRALKKATSKKLILSGEAFSFARTHEERNVFDEMFDGMEVRIIGYLLNPENWLESWRTQTANLCQKCLEEGVDTGPDTIFNYSKDSWLIDDESLVSFFPESARFFSYEEEMAKSGSIVNHFLQAIGLDLALCPDSKSFWVNISAEKAVAQKIP